MRLPLPLPGRIASQIALLVMGVICAVYLLVCAAFVLGTRDAPPPHWFGTVATMARTLALAPPGLRQRLVDAENASDEHIRFVLDDRPAARPGSAAQVPGGEALAVRLGADFHIDPTRFETANAESAFRITLPGGTALEVLLSPEQLAPPPAPLPTLLLVILGVLALNVVVLTFWASRAVTLPLARFAAAAEGFSIDDDPAFLSETGSTEVRVAARALNRMRDRVRGLFAARTHMLAAIGHDLRTPITRLRLRAEFVEDRLLREQLLRDIGQMDRMVHSVLSFLRPGGGRHERAAADLSSLLQTIADEFCDLGHRVRYEGPPRIATLCDAGEIERAVTNLVENAVRYGDDVVIGLASCGEEIDIDVADDGPGIPGADRDRLLEPFTRGDEARNQDRSEGFGLGLSIAAAIAASHGGRLDLLDNAPCGLRARLRLPAPPGESRRLAA